ncbi:MAG: ATP-binding protein [Planctomycetaceae bacterium]|nr:MAG: ATP-binding protein [Planctomycetaceae bacterium]
MATTRKLADLFRAIAAEDLFGAATIASEICKGEERKGHRSAARVLRGALHANGTSHAVPETARLPDQQTIGGLFTTALTSLSPEPALDDVVLTPSARRLLQSIVAEWKKRDVLHRRGLQPRSKLLFHGVPGCGKSLTARALAHELGIPVYMVRFDAVIGAYLGQTAIHLRQLFHFAETTPCVLLLDELDALGKQRGNPLDVGELDRIVIALMQELEHSRPQGLIVGTSNLPRHLDDALWRRFDLALAFNAPAKRALTGFAKRVAAKFQIALPHDVLNKAVSAKTFADAEAIIMAEARRIALLEE